MNYELILEIIAVITGMLSIWYSYRINILVYPIGMISLALYVFIFIKNGLYANAVINFLYFVTSIFGWWNWLRQRTTDNGQQSLSTIFNLNILSHINNFHIRVYRLVEDEHAVGKILVCLEVGYLIDEFIAF